MKYCFYLIQSYVNKQHKLLNIKPIFYSLAYQTVINNKAPIRIEILKG